MDECCVCKKSMRKIDAKFFIMDQCDGAFVGFCCNHTCAQRWVEEYE